MSAMECPRRDKLLRDYQDALLEAATAQGALSKLAGTTVLREYRTLLQVLEEAEAKTSVARSAYEKHITKHRCTSEK